MAARIQYGEKFFRMRRGKMVEIPEEWVGKTLTPQAKRKRKSKDDGNPKTRKGRGKRR